MTRFTVRFYSFALFACLAFCAQPALAVVNFDLDVFPTFASEFGIPFTTPLPAGFPDADNDEVADFIFAGGNELDTRNIDPFDPTGPGGNGLAWDDPEVWRNYESKQNILVGQSSVGTLSITGGKCPTIPALGARWRCRYRHGPQPWCVQW